MGNLPCFKKVKCSPNTPKRNIVSSKQNQIDNWSKERKPMGRRRLHAGLEEVDGSLLHHNFTEGDLEKLCHYEENEIKGKIQNNEIWRKDCQENNSLRTENKISKSENERLRSERKELISKLENYKEEILKLQMECDDLKTRLSKLASDRLTDNNPNITDLSDDNRAIKVGEKFLELYNNEWSDAFEEMTEAEKMTEEDAIKLLFNTIKDIFDMCKSTAQEQLKKLEEAILEFTGNKEMHPMLATSLKVYKDERKKKFENTVPSTTAMIKAVFPPNKTITGKLNIYVDVATRICWSMCIQDPPMVLYLIKKGKKFDEQYFKAYTECGNRIAFLVWPALLICTDGHVVQKGIAQGKNKKKKKLSSTSSVSSSVHKKTNALKPDTNPSTTIDDDTQALNKTTHVLHVKCTGVRQ